MKIYKISKWKHFPDVLSSDQMLDLILENSLRDWQGKLDYDRITGGLQATGFQPL